MSYSEVLKKAKKGGDKVTVDRAGASSIEVPMDTKKLRESLGLSQSQFARRYGIELKTLKNWEQGRREPDGAALSYLRVIEKLPQVVADALSK